MSSPECMDETAPLLADDSTEATAIPAPTDEAFVDSAYPITVLNPCLVLFIALTSLHIRNMCTAYLIIISAYYTCRMTSTNSFFQLLSSDFGGQEQSGMFTLLKRMAILM